MLSFPQPPDSEVVDGCPLVLLPDTAAEVIPFLKAIFMPDYFLPFPAPTKFHIIVGCLRLSHKYEVEYLRRRALVHLSSGYRTSLAEWDSSHYANFPSTSRSAAQIKSWNWIGDSGRIAVIQLAREVDALWVLPTAFYRLSSRFNTPSSGLGTVIFHGTVFNGVHTILSVQDQKAFLSGNVFQARSAADIMHFLSDPMDIPECVSPTQCAIGRLREIECSPVPDTAAPLDAWDADDWESLEEGVCAECLAVLRRTHAEARQALWDNLPEMYRLPSWEEPEKMKSDAIGNVVL
ncbi:hypothetical protein FB451DRAFT_1221294 [Mycena latifolia]|nr:hypothetical protein FB451DRAFT_1221294 [Mycena latifolia]